MDFLLGLLASAFTLAAIVVVGVIMAGLFIAVLALATGIDGHIQQEEDRSR